MVKNKYYKRELTESFVYPIIFLIILFSAVKLGYLKDAISETLYTYLIIGTIAGAITFWITYQKFYKK